MNFLDAHSNRKRCTLTWCAASFDLIFSHKPQRYNAKVHSSSKRCNGNSNSHRSFYSTKQPLSIKATNHFVAIIVKFLRLTFNLISLKSSFLLHLLCDARRFYSNGCTHIQRVNEMKERWEGRTGAIQTHIHRILFILRTVWWMLAHTSTAIANNNNN